MARFHIQSDDGRTLVIEGDAPPQDDELDELFASVPKAQTEYGGIKGYEPMPEIKDLTPPTLSPFTEAFGFKPSIMPTERQPVDFTPERVPSMWTEVPKQLFAMSPQAKLDTETQIEAQAESPVFDRSQKGKWIDQTYNDMVEALGDWTGNPEKIARLNALKAWRDEEMMGLGFQTVDPFAAPKMERITPQQAGLVFGINPQGRTAANIANAQGAVAGLTESFATPEGATMVGPAAIAKPIATAFIGMMAKDALEQTGTAIKKYSEGDVAGGDAALVAAVATGTMLGLPALAGKGPDKARELAKLIEKGEFKPRITPEEAALLRNRLPPRAATPEMLPELQRTKELVDQAIQEATQTIVEPGKVSALELLQRQTQELTPVEGRPEFRPGGGEPIGGKTSFNREGVENAAQQEAAQPIRNVRQEPVEGQAKVSEEVSRPKTDAGGGEGKIVSEADALQARGYSELIRNKMTPEQKAAALSEPIPTPEADAARYWEIQDRIKAEPDPAKKMQLYQELGLEAELIKNRNPTNPSNPPERPAAKTLTEHIESGVAAIERLQAKLRKGAQSGDTLMGVPSAILDTALEAARLALKAGKPVAQAVEAAVRHIKFNLKDVNETEMRQRLESVLKDEGLLQPTRKEKPATAEVPAKTGSGIEAAKAKGIKAPTLDDIYKIFEPEPTQKPTLKERAVNIAEGFRTGLSSKFRPLNKLAEDISKSYGLKKPRDIAGVFEALKGSQGKGEAEIYRFDRDVSKLVEGSEKDFNAYMFLRRSMDRLYQDLLSGESRRKVSDYTLDDLKSNLASLQAKIGPEKLAQFENAAARYQRYLDAALNLQVESGRMSREVYNEIKNGNPFYAPFKVMKYIEETSKPAGVGKQIDTAAEYTKAMKGIEDADFKLGDMLGAARQSILMSRILADKNQAMRMIANLAPLDVDARFIKRLGKNESPPRGWEEVGVMENGDRVKYAVNKDVADAVSAFGETGAGVVARILSAFSVPFKAGATALNIPFQVSNLLADQPRAALISKYGIRGASDLIRYPLDFVHSLYSSISGDMLGRDNKLFQDFLDSGVAGGTVQEALTPDALKFHETTGVSKSKKLAQSVLYSIPNFAKAIEQTSKVMGVKRAMRFEGVESGAELAKQFPEAITELRRFSGSPDFGRQGKVTEQARLNLLYMFLNARIQGTVADLGRLTGRDGKKTAAQTWAKVGYVVGVPTAYLWYLNNNNNENREDFEKRPKQERQNYWLIPKHDKDHPSAYITTEDGEKVRDYWRIPKRESAKWLSNLTETALDFARRRDPESAKAFGVGMIEDLSPVNIQGDTLSERMESIGASLNPMIKAPLEIATGRDMYRHRNIVPEKMKDASPELQYTDRTPEAFKKLAELMPDVSPEFLRSPLRLENLTKNLTAGLLVQFLPITPVQGRSDAESNPLLQRFQSLPFTDQQKFRDEYEALKRQAADESLTRNREAQKLLDANKGKPLEEIINKIPRNKEGFIEDRKFAEHLVDAYIANEAGITAQEKLVLGLPIEQRAKYVANLIESAKPDDRPKLFDDLVKKKILTKAVYAELPEALQR